MFMDGFQSKCSTPGGPERVRPCAHGETPEPSNGARPGAAKRKFVGQEGAKGSTWGSRLYLSLVLGYSLAHSPLLRACVAGKPSPSIHDAFQEAHMRFA